jgi:DSF synthase
MGSFEKLFATLYASKHVRVELQKERKTVVLTLCPELRPCVTREVLDGLATSSQWIRGLNVEAPDSVRHMILASDWDDVFSLGGDLDFFVDCIKRRDRDSLLKYAFDCVRVGHVFHGGFEGTVSTTSVICGQALGGGLEGAASCQTIITEEGGNLQLPEIKFGMFPGMGAISYLSRRVPGPFVRDMVEKGHPVSTEQAYAVRMVDELVPRGQGLRAAHRLNEGLEHGFHARMATRYGLSLAQGPSLAELEGIASSWVDVAFKIDLRDMRLMNRLASVQLRLNKPVEAPARAVGTPSFALEIAPAA